MKRANDMWVGLTVLLVAAAMLGALLWVKQADLGRGQKTVVARFHDVGNARVGNAVVIRGVVAGHIQAIELAPAGWVHVRMKIDRAVELPSDPVVLLNESSLFGEWQATIVERSALPPDESVRKEIAVASGLRAVLPGAALPGIGKLTGVAGQIAGDVASVAGRVEVAFDDQAARELRGSIKNVSDLSAVLAKTVRTHASDLDTISLQLRTAVTSLSHTANTVQRTAGRIDSATAAGEVQHIVGDLTVTSSELRRAALQVRDLTDRVTKSQGRLDALLTNGDSVLMKINRGQGSLGLLVNNPSLYHQSDSLLVQLRALIADIKANPGRYVKLRIF